MSPEQRTAKSREIEERLFALPDFKLARSVMFFASFRSEVETGLMIMRALTYGKRVILPKVKGEELELLEIRDFEKDVSPGAWGISEPVAARPFSLREIDLIVVPGVAFDVRGTRIGYGAGFYDKLLHAYKKMTVALAFELQILPHIQADSHDVPVKKIVTEKRIIEINSK
jgi:5-formyltetrahydrofolate cyclo-ligase